MKQISANWGEIMKVAKGENDRYNADLSFCPNM